MTTHRLADLGERALIERMVSRLGPASGVLVGPGDDAAVLERPDGRVLLAADLLVEGRHFRTDLSSPADIGAKAMAVNVSDIAAMGGVPRAALVSFGAPGETPVEVAEGIIEGLTSTAASFGVAIVGGDTVGADRLIVSIALLGEVAAAGPVLRSGARAGDVLCVTGSLGGAAAGLAILRGREGDDRWHALGERAPHLLEAHRRARARVAEGTAAAAAGASAMIDISDGLLSDVGHLCAASGVAAHIDGASVPVAPGVRDADELIGAPPGASPFAMAGGDDYELAIAIDRSAVEPLAAAIAPTPLTVVGSFAEGAGLSVDGWDPASADAIAWDHFRA